MSIQDKLIEAVEQQYPNCDVIIVARPTKGGQGDIICRGNTLYALALLRRVLDNLDPIECEAPGDNLQ